MPTLSDYIRIPNVSPDFDPEFLTNGLNDQAMELLVNWVKEQDVAGLSLEVIREEGRTPVMFCTVAPAEGYSGDSTVLLYGHMDKQPPMDDGGWLPEGGPYTPVIKDDKLYGRGGADDGYSVFAAVTGIKAMQEQGIAHARYVIFIESSEESGSPDLPYYVRNMMDRIGTPDLIVCLDSGCGNYDQLWMTTSLRGVVNVNMKVKIMNSGVHSGSSSGAVADSFRIARMLLNRVENVETGELIGDVFYSEIPEGRLAQAAATAEILGDGLYKMFPLVDGALPNGADNVQRYLNKTWRPTLTVTGADGLPASATAGNVLRSYTTLKLSFRLPPTVKSEDVAAYIRTVLTENPPYGAEVTVEGDHGGDGWNAPAEEEWLANASNEASKTFWGNPSASLGEGGSIPFMGMLGELYPQAQFWVVGVLGPGSNAHASNEFCHIPFAKRLTASIAYVLTAHAIKHM